jgi:hypothetical protein
MKTSSPPPHARRGLRRRRPFACVRRSAQSTVCARACATVCARGRPPVCDVRRACTQLAQASHRPVHVSPRQRTPARAVLRCGPTFHIAAGLAPCSSSSATMAAWPPVAAMCSGVAPSCAAGSKCGGGACSARASFIAARCSLVLSSDILSRRWRFSLTGVAASVLASHFSSSAATAALPCVAAVCNGVWCVCSGAAPAARGGRGVPMAACNASPMVSRCAVRGTHLSLAARDVPTRIHRRQRLACLPARCGAAQVAVL